MRPPQEEYALRPHSSIMLRGLLLLHFLHLFILRLLLFLLSILFLLLLLIPYLAPFLFFPRSSYILLYFFCNLSNSTTSSSSYADDDDDDVEVDVRKKEKVRITREERKLDADDYSLIQVGWYKSTNTDAAAGEKVLRKAPILTQPRSARRTWASK